MAVRKNARRVRSTKSTTAKPLTTRVGTSQQLSGSGGKGIFGDYGSRVTKKVRRSGTK